MYGWEYRTGQGRSGEMKYRRGGRLGRGQRRWENGVGGEEDGRME